MVFLQSVSFCIMCFWHTSLHRCCSNLGTQRCPRARLQNGWPQQVYHKVVACRHGSRKTHAMFGAAFSSWFLEVIFLYQMPLTHQSTGLHRCCFNCGLVKSAKFGHAKMFQKPNCKMDSHSKFLYKVIARRHGFKKLKPYATLALAVFSPGSVEVSKSAEFANAETFRMPSYKMDSPNIITKS